MIIEILKKIRFKSYMYRCYMYNKIKYCNRKIKIDKTVRIGKGVQIGQDGEVEILEGSSVWEYTKLIPAGGRIKIHKNVQIGAFCWFTGQGGIEIETNVLFADKVNIIANTHIYEDIQIPIMNQKSESKKIIIKEGSWIGCNVTILQGVTIGRNVVIGANSLVNRSIPDFSVAIGNPARVIKRYDVELGIWIKV